MGFATLPVEQAFILETSGSSHPQGLRSPFSAVVCVLGTVPMLGLWTTRTVSAHVGHSTPLLKPNSKELEGSKFPRDREYGEHPRKGFRKPELSSHSGIDLLCDLGQSLAFSGLQFPPLLNVCRIKKEKGG